DVAHKTLADDLDTLGAVGRAFAAERVAEWRHNPLHRTIISPNLYFGVDVAILRVAIAERLLDRQVREQIYVKRDAVIVWHQNGDLLRRLLLSHGLAFVEQHGAGVFQPYAKHLLQGMR